MKKEKFVKLMTGLSSAMASLALMVTSGMVNSTCYFFLHQPELPQDAEKLRRCK